MNKKEIFILFEKYANKTATVREQRILENWYHSEQDKQRLNETEADFLALKNEIWKGTLVRSGITRRSRRISHWATLSAAAAIFLAIGVGLLLFTETKKTSSESIEVTEDISPGKQGATLTLANGKRIRLSEAINGILSKEVGVLISKTSDGQLLYEVQKSAQQSDQINILSTGNGETYSVKLPDGSLVWLNSGSSLKYSVGLLVDGRREVQLSGEGYFEVAKDHAHPFIVRTLDQEIKVLGTHFNVNSYTDEGNSKTTLLEGSVHIVAFSENSSVKYGKPKLLQPGQEATLNKAHQITVKEVDVMNAIAWKNGMFYFDRADLKTVMRQFARWYDVEVEYLGVIPQRDFSGKIFKSVNASEALSILKDFDVKFKIKGKKILVYP